MNNLSKNTQIKSQHSLIEYIQINYKKRKNTNFSLKNNDKNTHLNKKHAENIKNNIEYKRLNKSNNKHYLYEFLREKQLTYVEQNNKKTTLFLYNLSKKIDPLINKNQNKYRSINNECLIETVASSFSYSILLKEKFNVFDSFKELTKVVRVYKKEAEILNTLIISKLIELYINLQKDILLFKSNIKKGAKTKIKTISNKHTPPFIYGAYLFNPSSTKLFFNKKELIIKSTTQVLTELDSIFYKQQIIFKYIKYLSIGIS